MPRRYRKGDLCRRGHPLVGENITPYRTDRPDRFRCKACILIRLATPKSRALMRAAKDRYRAKQPKLPPKPNPRARFLGGVCKYGHKLVAPNAYVAPGGRVMCSMCRLRAVKKYHKTPSGVATQRASEMKKRCLTPELYQSITLLTTLKKELQERYEHD